MIKKLNEQTICIILFFAVPPVLRSGLCVSV